MKKYCVLHQIKNKTGSHSTKLDEHIRREKISQNIDISRTKLNENLIGNGKHIPTLVDKLIKSKYDLSKKKKNKNGEYEQRKIRKDSVKSCNVVLSASQELFYNPDKGIETTDKKNLNKWKNESVKWLQKEYGDNLVSATLHLDETTPHIHATFVPLIETENKSHIHEGQNQVQLLARPFCTPAKFRKMHTDYAKAMQSAGFDLHRGEERKIGMEFKDERKNLRDLKNENHNLEGKKSLKKLKLNKSLKSWNSFQALEKELKNAKTKLENLKIEEEKDIKGLNLLLKKDKEEENQLQELENKLISLRPKCKLKVKLQRWKRKL